MFSFRGADAAIFTLLILRLALSSSSYPLEFLGWWELIFFPLRVFWIFLWSQCMALKCCHCSGVSFVVKKSILGSELDII